MFSPCRIRDGLTSLLFTISAVASPAHALMGNLEADAAFGQADDIRRSIGHPLDSSSFAEPRGIAIDRSTTPNRVYVSDSEYSRVLGWADVDSLISGQPADLIIGQSDPGAAGCNQRRARSGQRPPATPMDLCEPRGLAVDDVGNLFVADTENCRIAIFLDPFATDVAVDMILGVSNFCGNGPDHLFGPADVAIGPSGSVLVADRLNCRVLAYDDPLGSGDGVADRVFGQVDYESRNCHPMYFPEALDVDPSGALFIGTGTWLLRFDDISQSTAVEDGRLGTPLCNRACHTCETEETAASTCSPIGLAVANDGRMYVADSGNERVLSYADPINDLEADRVYGQPDFTGDGAAASRCDPAGPSAENFCFRRLTTSEVVETRAVISGAAVAVDSAERLYVADTLHHRVLRFDAPETATSADLVLGQLDFDTASKPATAVGNPHVELVTTPGSLITQGTTIAVDAESSRILLYQRFNPFWVVDMPIGVIGQPNFDSVGCNTGGRSAGSLCAPTASTVDSLGNLWVADTGNDRVLRFDAPWMTWDSDARDWVIRTQADAVLGQPDFESAGCAVGPAGLCRPTGVAADAQGGLYISDSGNHRVVYFLDPVVDTEADSVIGQRDFDTGVCNSEGLGAASLCDPRGLHLDSSGELVVADAANNRVLIFDTSQSPPWLAHTVFGQSGSFMNATCSAGAGGLCVPSDAATGSDGGLFVADSGNHRVLQYDSISNTSAERVFGQPDMQSVGCNTGGVSGTSLCNPTTVAVGTTSAIEFGAGGESLLVGDEGNDRVVGYAAPYCLVDYRADLAIDGISGPIKSRLVINRKRGPGAHKLGYKHKQATKFFVSVFSSPLFRISTPQGMVYERRLPYVTNTSVSNLRAKFRSYSPKMVVGEVLRSSPGRQELNYKGDFEDLDLSSLDTSEASLLLQFGSTCITSDLSCRHGTRKSKCQMLR